MISVPALRVFVTDDEAPARRKLLRFLAEEPGVVIAGETSNGPDTIAGVRDTQPDLLFLDIQMPGMDGFAVVDALGDSVPRIIFVTAHDEYALRALEIHAFDYLLKPFDRARFPRSWPTRDGRRRRGGTVNYSTTFGKYWRRYNHCATRACWWKRTAVGF